MSTEPITPPTPDAVPFVRVAVPHPRRPRFGRHVRVMLSGATVDVKTAAQAKRWRGKSLSLGLLLDQLFTFAAKKGFRPDRTRK